LKEIPSGSGWRCGGKHEQTIVFVIGFVITSFAYAQGQYSENDVRRTLAGDWKFTPAQVESLNHTRAELLAAPIYEILSSAGIRLTKWDNANEPLGAKAFY